MEGKEEAAESDILKTRSDSSLVKRDDPVPRREVIKRAIKYLIEEIGIPNNGQYYKGVVVFSDDGTGRLIFDFGIHSEHIARQAKLLADGHVMSFMMSFNKRWSTEFGDRRFVSEEEAQKFLKFFRQ